MTSLLARLLAACAIVPAIALAQAPSAKVTPKPNAEHRRVPPQLPGTKVTGNPVKITTVEGITEYRLPNGLKVLLFPDASKPTVTVNVTYLVGSRHENYGETGMAHLLEHLMFKGAANNRAITEQFAARGMQFNGTTSLDRTNYYEV